MGRFLTSLVVTGVLIAIQMGAIGSPGSTLLDEGAPEDAIVYFTSDNDDIEFIVYPDQIELLGEDVLGTQDGEVVILIEEIMSVKTTGSKLKINTVEGQMWVDLGFFGSSRIKKAAKAIEGLIGEEV